MEFNNYKKNERETIAKIVNKQIKESKEKVIYSEDDLKPSDWWYSCTDGEYGRIEYPLFYEPRIENETIDLGIDWDKINYRERLKEKFGITKDYKKGRPI